MHWFDDLYPQIEGFLADKDAVVCNAGMSVSGLQHVGSLRGEIVLNHFIATRLRATGKTVTQQLVLYTQDRWKGTPEQVGQFETGEAVAYTGYRMIEVPDPNGCHDNWVDHYWAGFADPMDRFAPSVELSRTTDLYRTEAMQTLVREVADRGQELRKIVNRYRPRNPLPEGWIPFEPVCLSCRRIGDSRALGFTDGEIDYECECGGSGSSPMELGKLNWRVEWPVLWALFGVNVEPFGKDHAAPGGSRETSREIAETILGVQAPFGIPYEWVGYAEDGKDLGDMTSSGFTGFGPQTWLEVAEPEVLRFLFAMTPIRRRLLLDLSRVDAYHQRYDQAETSFYGDLEGDQGRSYLLSQLEPPSEDPPFQLPFRHASLLAQVAPAEDGLDWSMSRLAATGMVEGDLSSMERERVARRLAQALRWVRSYAHEGLQVVVQKSLSPEVKGALSDSDRDALGRLHEALSGVPWEEGSIKEAMIGFTADGDLPVSTKQLFTALYLVFLGKPSGPRAAPLLALLDREFALQRLEQASGG